MKPIIKIVLIIVISIILISTIFAIVDYNRTKKELIPIFTIKTKIYKDGGSVEYLGLGYKIIKYNQLDNYENCDNEYHNNVNNLDCIIKGKKDFVFGFWTLKYE